MLYHICGYNHERGMGQAGFFVKLFPAWKDAVAGCAILTQEGVNCAIENMGCSWLDNHGYDRTFKEDDSDVRIWEPRTSIRVSWGEWGPEHISVPGNACGLDLDTGSIHAPRGGRVLCPHNVDSLEQASLLLTVFLFFADTVVLELEGKGTAPDLLVACQSFVKAATDAHAHWDSDRDAKVGKLLAAMAGYLKGYRADLDAAHAAIARVTKG